MLTALFDFILHIDVHLGAIIQTYGVLSYAILFAIIFVETGLVFFPFLPGDSLLFAAGAFSAIGSLSLGWVLGLMMVAAIIGDTVNYWIGHFFGEKLVENPKIPINREHIEETQRFFDKHGGKTIILARFVPIVRTFAPFVAGIGKMKYGQFFSYNVIGGTSWVLIATLAGYFFGNIPFVRDNFSLVVLGIVGVSIVPMIIPLIKKWIKHE
ncbi:TPA: DedA family protein [Candidatus Collierbacteria bacterium]|nr:MAG: Protein dedA [Microgenomates group bacterium GW2011_GWE1_47_12]HBO10617.1 DedA family protein [Candidatus Collierbacteria bacterium]